MLARAIALLLLLIGAPAALAHAPQVGANGGPQVNAGPYHVEMVVEGETVAVFLTDHAGKLPQRVGEFKATADLTIEGGTVRVELVSERPGKLAGRAGRPLPAKPAGTVQIRSPTGFTVQARFR